MNRWSVFGSAAQYGDIPLAVNGKVSLSHRLSDAVL
jgi:hypothetical protein